MAILHSSDPRNGSKCLESEGTKKWVSQGNHSCWKWNSQSWAHCHLISRLWGTDCQSEAGHLLRLLPRFPSELSRHILLLYNLWGVCWCSDDIFDKLIVCTDVETFKIFHFFTKGDPRALIAVKCVARNQCVRRREAVIFIPPPSLPLTVLLIIFESRSQLTSTWIPTPPLLFTIAADICWGDQG